MCVIMHSIFKKDAINFFLIFGDMHDELLILIFYLMINCHWRLK